MFYGRGAGKLPTANAVVADVVDAIKHKNVNIIIKWDEYSPENQSKGENLRYAYYVRFEGMAPSNIKDAKIVAYSESNSSEFAVLTNEMTAAQLEEFLSGVEGCSVLSKMRIIG